MTKAQTLFLPGFIGVCITATILILLGRNDRAACLELAKNFSGNLWNLHDEKIRRCGHDFYSQPGPHLVAFFLVGPLRGL